MCSSFCEGEDHLFLLTALPTPIVHRRFNNSTTGITSGSHKAILKSPNIVDRVLFVSNQSEFMSLVNVYSFSEPFMDVFTLDFPLLHKGRNPSCDISPAKVTKVSECSSCR